MIINYTKYFKDNFDLQFQFEKGYINLQKMENDWVVINCLTYITLDPLVNLFETIFNMGNFDSKVICIYDLKINKIVYHREIFMLQRTLTIWKSFVKKKKCNRLGLKMLKVVSEHLGNPIFIDFSV